MVKKAEGLNACTCFVVVFGLLLGLAVSEFGVRVAFNPRHLTRFLRTVR